MKTGVGFATLSDVKSSGDEEAQGNLSINADSAPSDITQENTTSKSEELKEIKVDEAPVNDGAESKHSSEQRLDEETKKQTEKATECHRPVETNSEDLMDEVKEPQGEDIILEEQKEGEVRNLIEPSREDPTSKSVKHFPLLFVCLVLFLILLALIFHMLSQLNLI